MRRPDPSPPVLAGLDPARPEPYPESVRWLERALKVIPGQTMTFSKSLLQNSLGASPLYLRRARGAEVEDVDGHRYLDFTSALCPIILGYNHPEVSSAVAAQLERGSLFSLPDPSEVELCERLVELIPCAEKVRLVKSGSDATSAAIRVARASTGRDLVACCGYHGWHDWYVGTTSRPGGVPRAVRDLTQAFTYNDLDSLARLLETHPGGFAAVILEPTGVIRPWPGFLEGVKELTHRHGALLIFDEVVTGFRLSLGGAQELFGVEPDLAAFGKAMANGFPLACLVGRAGVMDALESVFVSGTFSSECISIAASLACLEVLERDRVLETIRGRGERFLAACQELIHRRGLAEVVSCQGYPTRWVMGFAETEADSALELKTFCQQELARRGVLFSGSHNLSLAHDEAVIDKTLGLYDEVLGLLAEVLAAGRVADRLEGRVLTPVFRKA